jgi:hypothetical protein
MAPSSEIHEEEIPEVVNLIDSQAEKVEANLVRASRSYIGNLKAEEVELHQAVALNVEAHDFQVNSSLSGVSQSSTTSARNSILLTGRTEKLEMNNSLALGIYSNETNLEAGSQTGILISNKVSGGQIRTVFLVASQVEGPVETQLDTRQVALASIIAGLVCGIAIMVGQILFRHKK